MGNVKDRTWKRADGDVPEEYEMGNSILGRTTKGKGLGVTFSADMKVSEPCGIAASKGYHILRLIRRTITYKEKHVTVPLYKAILCIFGILYTSMEAVS